MTVNERMFVECLKRLRYSRNNNNIQIQTLFQGRCRRGDQCTLSHILPVEQIANIQRQREDMARRQQLNPHIEQQPVEVEQQQTVFLSSGVKYNQWELEDEPVGVPKKKKKVFRVFN
jgi:hypothetical protein